MDTQSGGTKKKKNDIQKYNKLKFEQPGHVKHENYLLLDWY